MEWSSGHAIRECAISRCVEFPTGLREKPLLREGAVFGFATGECWFETDWVDGKEATGQPRLHQVISRL